MSFLNKIHAIHPRGRQWERPKPERGKSGFRTPKGKTLVERLDWLAVAVDDLASGFDYDEKTNALLHEFQAHHSLTSHSHPYEKRLKQALALSGLVPKVAAEIKRLYGQGALPEEIDRATVHAFLDEAKEVSKETEMLKRRLDEYEKWARGVKKLGF